MGSFVLPLFCFLSLICFGYSTNKHMIGKDVGEATSDDVHSRRLVGTRDEQGSKHKRGLPDQPGIVDYKKVRRIVRLKVEEETSLLRRKVDGMETKIRNLASQTSETRLLRIKVDEMATQIQNLTSQLSVLSCVHGVKHEGRCYWAEAPLSANYTEAQKICSNKASRLADIYGKNHYEKIMSYLRRKLNGGPYMFVWTGMKKIYRNNIAQLSNGSPAPYTRQRRHYWDDADRSRTHVYLLVQSSTSISDQGMGAGDPTLNSYGSLCQTE